MSTLTRNSKRITDRMVIEKLEEKHDRWGMTFEAGDLEIENAWHALRDEIHGKGWENYGSYLGGNLQNGISDERLTAIREKIEEKYPLPRCPDCGRMVYP